MKKVGIIEICEKGHYMLTNALIKTYLSNPDHHIYVFVKKDVYELLISQNPKSSNLEYIILEDFANQNSFLSSIQKYQLDRVHIATVTKFYKSFFNLQFNDTCSVFFHFHNIDLWFESSFKIQIKRLFKVFSNYNKEVQIIRNLKYSAKEILRDFYRKKLIRKVTKFYKLVILSEAQRHLLSQYTDASKAIIFPTLIFEPDYYKDTSANNSNIRICIPGSVTQNRREYFKLFEVIETNFEFYKTNFLFDLLGFVPVEEKALMTKIRDLKDRGLKINFYENFINSDFFDKELFKCDYVLSNILLDDNNKIQSKETAAVYHMIRGAKPGIFPSGFQLDKAFEETVLKFDDYSKIHELFVKITKNKDLTVELKQKALKLSLQNSPKELLQTLYNNP